MKPEDFICPIMTREKTSVVNCTTKCVAYDERHYGPDSKIITEWKCRVFDCETRRY